MVLNVRGACGTAVQMSGTIAHPDRNLVRSSDITIALPACATQCGDGIDNDGDGAIDYPADIGCDSAQDSDESNPLPPKVTPIAECVALNPDGTLVAHFGYQNDGSSPVDVPVGTRNYLTPGVADRDQPTTFFTGRVNNILTVTFPSTETLSWIVGEATASASIATQRCEGGPLGCVETDNTTTLRALDSTARAMRRNVRRISQKVLSVQSTGANASKAASYRQLAQSLYLEQWAEIWGSFPRVSKNCTSCASIDFTAEITDINARATNEQTCSTGLGALEGGSSWTTSRGRAGAHQRGVHPV